jgi:3-deoxy-D-manno-octulosonic acid kinase
LNLSAIVKPCQLKVYQQGNIYCLYNENAIDNFTPQLLDSDYWQQQNSVIGSAQGRGTTWFVAYEHQQWVLRHYFRGGLIGKLIRDSYFFYTMEKTRALQEFNLLQYMQNLALPAPLPIACRVIRNGLFYRADLLSQRIVGASDLVALLSKSEIDANLWLKIGKTIAQFHQKGIYHHDLNAHNILIDGQDKVWLIDFDRAEKRAVNSTWQQANMMRLLRSFRKEKQQLAQFNWQESDWQALCKGYQSLV